jgi:hypothetical protein
MLFILGAFALAACGSDSKSGSNAAPSTTIEPSTVTTVSATGSDGCGDVVSTLTQRVTSKAVTKIQVIGGCSLVNISTSLANDGIAAALDICDQAAAVVYVGSVKGVSVVSSSNKEIALGIKGSPCMGAP